jgi:hypothetical protein
MHGEFVTLKADNNLYMAFCGMKLYVPVAFILIMKAKGFKDYP